MSSTSFSHPYVEVLPGSLPIVISVPHGGYERPAHLPDREPSSTMCVEEDVFTQELARDIHAAFARDTVDMRTPTIVIFHLHRIKADANRDLPDAAPGPCPPACVSLIRFLA